MIEITSRLPSNYQEVEYIQSSGTQYIDTGYIVNKSDTISWEFTAMITSQSEAYMGANGYLQFHVTSSGVGVSTLNASGLGAKKTFRIDFSNSVTKLYIDNTLVETQNWSGSYNGTNVKLGIFKLGDAGNGWHKTTSPVSCTLYEYAINIGGNEVSRCVPCYRKADNVGGVYDLVNGVFHTNAGTGSFSVGNAVGGGIVITAGGTIPQKYAIRRRMMMAKEVIPPDPNTLLLLHGKDFVDSSIYSRVITNTGVTVSTAQSKFGGSSLYFNGSSYISMPSTDFGSNNFTIDWWEYATNSNAGSRFTSVFCTSYSTQAGGILLFVNEGSNPRVYMSNKTGGAATSDWNVLAYKQCGTNTLNQWIHRAVVRSGTNLMFFKDGTVEYTYSVGTNVVGYSSERPWCIGAWSTDYMNTGYQFIGYLEEFRVSNVARWTSNFTVPTKPYDNKISK